jgi:hypothetical protein
MRDRQFGFGTDLPAHGGRGFLFHPRPGAGELARGGEGKAAPAKGRALLVTAWIKPEWVGRFNKKEKSNENE